MESLGWHSVPDYLPSAPKAAIIQGETTEKLWLLRVIFALSLWFGALWFHLKVHRRTEWSWRISSPCLGISKHITAYGYEERLTHTHTLQQIDFQSSEVEQLHSHKILINHHKLSNTDYVPSTQIIYKLHFASVITRERAMEKHRKARLSTQNATFGWKSHQVLHGSTFALYLDEICSERKQTLCFFVVLCCLC